MCSGFTAPRPLGDQRARSFWCAMARARWRGSATRRVPLRRRPMRARGPALLPSLTPITLMQPAAAVIIYPGPRAVNTLEGAPRPQPLDTDTRAREVVVAEFAEHLCVKTPLGSSGIYTRFFFLFVFKEGLADSRARFYTTCLSARS